jgi:hypothetical protein
MEHGLQSYHPFSQFDLAAIGIALVFVMGVLLLRRIGRMVFGLRTRQEQQSGRGDD